MKTLTIFVSSPGDVQNERIVVGSVVEKLQAKFWSFVRLELVLWEKKALRATAHFQDELIRPSDCDIVLGILWHRLGTPLPEQFLKEDGGRFDSGTEWEIVEAFEGFDASLDELGPEKASPDVLIYRRSDPRVPQEDPEREVLAAAQEQKAAQFFSDYFKNPDGTNERAFSPYRGLEEFKENLTAHLTDLILKRIPTLTRDYTPPPINGNPFLGLSHFDFHHNDRFFGRNRAIREVLEKLKAQDAKGHPFVLIYGASGYGKSSLMRAGVAPRLTAKAYLDDIPLWRRILITPSLADGNPIESIARALLSIDAEETHPDTPDGAPQIGLNELAKNQTSLPNFDDSSASQPASYDTALLTRLLTDPDKRPFAIADIVEALDALNTLDSSSESSTAQRGACLLLQIDQFEELFTTESISDADRQEFFSLLSHLTHTKRIWIVATMRSEYFPQIAEYKSLLPLVQHGGGYILEAPDDKELLEIIRYPALAARLDFENDPHSNNRNLSDDIYEAAQKQPDALPLLEFTLDELYQLQDIEAGDRTLNYDEYDAIGRLEGAIAKRAQTTYESLKQHQQSAHHHLFAKLVKVQSTGAGTATKKRAYLDTLQQAHSGAPAFLKAFQKNNLLVTDHEASTKNTGRTTVTLAHEALLTQWPLFKNWIEEHRTDLQAETRLQNQTSRWLEKRDKDPKEAKARLLSEANLAEALRVKNSELFDLDQDTKTYLQASERKAKRKTRFMQSALVLFAVLALGAGYLGYLSNENAKKEIKSKEEAEKQTELAKSNELQSKKRESDLHLYLANTSIKNELDSHNDTFLYEVLNSLKKAIKLDPQSIDSRTLAASVLATKYCCFNQTVHLIPVNTHKKYHKEENLRDMLTNITNRKYGSDFFYGITSNNFYIIPNKDEPSNLIQINKNSNIIKSFPLDSYTKNLSPFGLRDSFSVYEKHNYPIIIYNKNNLYHLSKKHPWAKKIRQFEEKSTTISFDSTSESISMFTFQNHDDDDQEENAVSNILEILNANSVTITEYNLSNTDPLFQEEIADIGFIKTKHASVFWDTIGDDLLYISDNNKIQTIIKSPSFQSSNRVYLFNNGNHLAVLDGNNTLCIYQLLPNIPPVQLPPMLNITNVLVESEKLIVTLNKHEYIINLMNTNFSKIYQPSFIKLIKHSLKELLKIELDENKQILTIHHDKMIKIPYNDYYIEGHAAICPHEKFLAIPTMKGVLIISLYEENYSYTLKHPVLHIGNDIRKPSFNFSSCSKHLSIHSEGGFSTVWRLNDQKLLKKRFKSNNVPLFSECSNYICYHYENKVFVENLNTGNLAYLPIAIRGDINTIYPSKKGQLAIEYSHMGNTHWVQLYWPQEYEKIVQTATEITSKIKDHLIYFDDDSSDYKSKTQKLFLSRISEEIASPIIWHPTAKNNATYGQSNSTSTEVAALRRQLIKENGLEKDLSEVQLLKHSSNTFSIKELARKNNISISLLEHINSCSLTDDLILENGSAFYTIKPDILEKIYSDCNNIEVYLIKEKIHIEEFCNSHDLTVKELCILNGWYNPYADENDPIDSLIDGKYIVPGKIYTPRKKQTNPKPKQPSETHGNIAKTVAVKKQMTYGEFAKKHGTTIAILNAMNGLDLPEDEPLAKGSSFYVPILNK